MTKNNLILSVAALAASVHLCRADSTEAFSSFGPNNGIYYSGALYLADPLAVNPAGTRGRAIPFMVSVDGYLERVDVPFYRRVRIPAGITPRPISLRADNEGLPGAVLESWSFTPGAYKVTGLSSVVRPMLRRGVTYWLAAELNPVGNAIDYWYLKDSTSRVQNAEQNAVGGPWRLYTVGLPAFRVVVNTPSVVIVNSLDANGRASGSSATSIGDPGNPVGSFLVRSIGVQFKPTANCKLDSVELPMDRSPSTSTFTSPRIVSLRADASGVPGALVESWSVVPLASPGNLIRFMSSTSPTLLAGATYWIALETNPSGSAIDYWRLNTIGAAGYFAQKTGLTGVWQRYYSSGLPALRVKGLPTGAGLMSFDAGEAWDDSQQTIELGLDEDATAE